MSSSMYDECIKKPLWTLEESWLLFSELDELTYEDFFRSDIDLGAGGITMINSEYSERTGKTFPSIPEGLVEFVNAYIAKGDLKPVKISDSSERYYTPSEIIPILETYTDRKAPERLSFLTEKAIKAQPISEAQLRKEYAQYVKKYPNDTPPPSWENDQKAMTKALGKKPSNRQIKQIRANLAPEAWKKRGRKKAS